MEKLFWCMALLILVFSGSGCSGNGVACSQDSDCPSSQHCSSGGGGVFFGGSVCLGSGEHDVGSDGEDVEQDIVDMAGKDTAVQDTEESEGAGVLVVFDLDLVAESKASSSVISYHCVSEEGALKTCTYECMFDAEFSEIGEAQEDEGFGEWGVCGESKTVKTKWAGEYRLHVRAMDKTGEVGENSFAWQKTYVGWESVSAGEYQTCAIDVDSGLWCWGTNGYGMGVAGIKTSKKAVSVKADKQWKSVSVGLSHVCAIDSSGGLWCWGSNADYQAGVEGASKYEEPVQVLVDMGGGELRENWTSVSAGRRHTCGIYSGTMFCWGTGIRGELGSLSTVAKEPRQVSSGEKWTGVTVGDSHSCGIRGGMNSGVWCWGSNEFGQIVGENRGSVSSPQELVMFRNEVLGGVSAGSVHTCGIREYDLYCWGRNNHGQVGIGQNYPDRDTPVMGTSEDGFTQVSSGVSHTCAIKLPNELWCWGKGLDGDGSAGAEVLRPTLMDVDGALDWKSVSAGSGHTCGIRKDSELWCWGQNNGYQLGLDREDKSAVAVPSKVRVHRD